MGGPPNLYLRMLSGCHLSERKLMDFVMRKRARSRQTLHGAVCTSTRSTLGSVTAEMAQSEHWQGIPTNLSLQQFDKFVLPHLTRGSRGPHVKLTLHKIFNYLLLQLYLGCQWKSLPIQPHCDGQAEIHYTRIYRTFRRWMADGCIDAIFTGSVQALFNKQLARHLGRSRRWNHNRRQEGRR